MAWDAARARTVVFGNLTAAWEWDGTDWVARPTSPTPPGRAGGALAYDPVRRRLVLFSGTSPPFRDDTWEYGPVAPATWSTFGNGCAGSAGTPVLDQAPGSLPWLGDTFVLRIATVPAAQAALVAFGSRAQWGAVLLPLPLAPYGMPGCTLFAGGNVLLFAPGTGGVASVSVAIPNVAGLLGATIDAQAVVTDPGANAAGLVVTQAGTLTIGGR
jgi:hypothetical protein